MLDVTIGYGYRPLRALWWVLGFVMVGTLLFRRGYQARLDGLLVERPRRQIIRAFHGPAAGHPPR